MSELPPRSVWRVGKPTSAPLPPATDGLMEEGGDAVPVRVEIVQNDVTTGWDDGALGFEESAVWFSGLAISFRIAAQDVLPGTYACSGVEPVTDGEAWQQGLPLRYPRRDVWIRMRVLEMDERNKWDDEARLVREVKRLRAAGGSGEIVSQYPPLAPRPGLLRPPTFVQRFQLLLGGVSCALLLGSLFIPANLTSAFVRLLGVFLSLGLAISSKGPTTAKLRRIALEEGQE